MQPFRHLKVWQKADALLARIEPVCDDIRRYDRKLASQLREAAASVPATIAEGRGRATDKDFAHFVTMAISSTNEVENHLHRALRRKYVSLHDHDELVAANAEVRRMMLFGLRRRLLGD
jgi:four helix bundle protein